MPFSLSEAANQFHASFNVQVANRSKICLLIGMSGGPSGVSPDSLTSGHDLGNSGSTPDELSNSGLTRIHSMAADYYQHLKYLLKEGKLSDEYVEKCKREIEQLEKAN